MKMKLYFRQLLTCKSNLWRFLNSEWFIWNSFEKHGPLNKDAKSLKYSFQTEMLVFYNQKHTFTLDLIKMAITGQCSHFRPPENTNKPKRVEMGALPRNGLTH